MSTSEVIRAITLGYNAREPVMLRGIPQIGKSVPMLAATEVLAVQHNLRGGVLTEGEPVSKGLNVKDYFGFIEVRLWQCGPGDSLGLTGEDGAIQHQAQTCPLWFPHSGRSDLPDYGILALEEITSGPQALQTAAYHMTLHRRLNDKPMKEGWSVVFTDSRGTFERVQFPDSQFRLDWVIDAELDPSLSAFLALRTDLINGFLHHLEYGRLGDVFPTERKWLEFDSWVKLGVAEDVLFSLAEGTIGDMAAGEYLGFRVVWRQQMMSLEEIMINPKGYPLPEDGATQYCIALGLAENATRDNFEAIATYLERFIYEANHPDIAVLCCKVAIRRCPEIRLSHAYSRFARKCLVKSMKQYWQERYVLLNQHGFSDSEIAKAAGVTRGVINRVRLGKYIHDHRLSYEGGLAIDNLVAALGYN